MSAKQRAKKLCAFEIRVRRTIQKHFMLNPGEHVLVAVSGGADSVALLLCLHKLASEFDLSLTIAHLNHRIRGPEGDEDEDFVRGLSAGLQLPFYSEAIEVKKQAVEGKHNLEEFARQKRYEFLRRTARRIGAQKIAVGHNLNDQAETILFRFIRGSGVEGLSAIHPVVDGLVIRPLLECSREAIVKYLKQKGADYRDDSTNKNMEHTRNRIRMELVPYLEKTLNPRLGETLAREAFLSRETWSFIEAEAKAALEGLCRRVDNGISIELHGLETLHPALQKQVLRQALKECLGSLRGVTSRHVDGILSLCGAGHSGGQIRISRQSVAVRQFDTLLLTKQPPQQLPSFSYRLDIPGECRIPEAGVVFRSKICSIPDLKTIRSKSSTQAFLDPQALPQFLTIRSKEPGDRYGGPGHRKVKKLLIDGKVPLLQRFDLPMVAAGKDVVWIPGFRPARTCSARPESQNCILVEMIRDATSPRS
jgi:tRNA(Ile)-lysidine synthase